MSQTSPGPRDAVARLRQRIVDRGAEEMLRRAVDGSYDAPRAPGWAAVATHVLTGLVHLLTLALVVGGVWIVVEAAAFLKAGGVVLLGIAAAVTPVARSRDEGTALGPSDAPQLFALLRRVADAAGAPLPHRVLVTDEFGAGVQGTRRRTLALGAPLWVTLSAQGRVALLGHELGHLAHRDLEGSWWVGRAVTSLQRWIYLVTSEPPGPRGGDIFIDYALYAEDVGPAERALGILYWPVRAFFTGVLGLLVLLDAGASRRREWRADLAGLRAGGTRGAVECEQAFLLTHAVQAALTRAALGARRDDPWSVVREALAAVDAPGLARRRRVAEQEGTRMDDTHPTTALRLRMLEARPTVSAAVVLDHAESRRVDAELAPLLEESGRRIVAAVRYRH